MMTAPVALITGVTGWCLSGGISNWQRIFCSWHRQTLTLIQYRPDRAPLSGSSRTEVTFLMHYGDMTDATNLIRIIQETQPTEIYNLAAQSHVKVSFETAEYTANADALGTLRLLEAIRILRMEDRVRFYQASTSELYGGVYKEPQSETTPFHPRSPYGGQALRLLDDCKLSRSLRHACLERHPLQS